MVYLPWLLLVLLAPYWLGPIVVWLTQKAGAHPVFEPFSPGRHSVPEDVAAAFRQTCDALATEGFHVVADLFQTGQMRHVSTRVALLENSGTDELALAVALFTAARPQRLVTSYAELPTKFRDGRSVSVHNSPIPGSFTTPPSRVVVRLPIVRDPARLCRIKRAYLERHHPGRERASFEHQNDPARFLAGAMVRELTEQVDAGRWRRDDRAGVFRPTFTSAWVMTWQLLPPFSMLRRWRIRRRAAAILRDLNMTGPDPRPIAQPRTRVSLRWVAVAAILVLLLNQLGSRLLRTTWSVPSDFVAPAAFPDAVRALEHLAGGAATPLVGTDSVGDSLVTEGFAVSVPSARAERIVAATQPRFLEKGFYLFRAEHHFGIGNRGDRVALFPRSDRYEILRLMGTNGWNYGIGPDSIVAWLAALERDHPFVLTGMGFDWVEGWFRSAISDADALARRFYAFCPDIVDQGTETVDALARELRESRQLYCWWD
jgi:Domain of unknown function (DUF4253)